MRYDPLRDEPAYLTTDDLARICRTSVETVRYWRNQGKGPAWFKVGRRVIYLRDDVSEWLERARLTTDRGGSL